VYAENLLNLENHHLRPFGLPASLPSPRNDSESLLPRPHLMAARASWHTLDFAIALGCGFAAIVMQERHLTFPLSIFRDSPSPWTHLLSGTEMIVFAACVAVLSGICGLHPKGSPRRVSPELVLIALSVSLSAYGVAGAMSFLVTTNPLTQLLEFLLTSSALFLSRVLWRRRSQDNFLRDIARKNVLIIGANPTGRAVENHLSSMHYMGVRLKGFVTLSDDTDDYTASGDCPIVGRACDVIALSKSMFVDEIIFSHRPATPNLLSNVLAQAQASGIDVRLIPSLSETLKDRSNIEYLGDLPTIVLHRCEKKAVSHLVKRVFDVVLGSIGLLALLPPFAVVAMLITIQSPGPVFYISKRVGYKGMTFSCYKFRSMIQGADSVRERLAHLNERQDILFKIAKDPRITSVGAFLRKYSVDELPQLWNVLKGDMSLVGPRPSISSEVSQYQTAHLRRLDVIPGMTGLWQVEARHDPSFDMYVNLDSKYVRDWSIWLDITILARTLAVVFKGTGT
jgi:exopolysaccharide biosynthesis polyprenyl glycosylphosphotransferase